MSLFYNLELDEENFYNLELNEENFNLRIANLHSPTFYDSHFIQKLHESCGQILRGSHFSFMDHVCALVCNWKCSFSF